MRVRLTDERGTSLVFSALGLVVVIGFAALAVDLGMLYSTESEAQRAADAAARAGAFELIYHPDDADQARDSAIHIAAKNLVRGEAADVRDADVTVDLNQKTVRVVVQRSSDRGNAFGGFFMGILGFDELGVAVDATAKAVPAGGANCILPVVIPARWMEGGTTPAQPGDTYDASQGDCWDCDGDGEGETRYQIGDQVTIYPGQGNQGSFQPGWWYLWNPAQNQGASHFTDWVVSCPDPSIVWAAPTPPITDKNGSNTSIVNEFRDLVQLDPSAQYVGNGEVSSDLGTASPRIRPIPLFNPDTFVKQGNSANFTIIEFAGIFVESVSGNQVTGRITSFAGALPAEDPNANTTAQVVQLIE